MAKFYNRKETKKIGSRIRELREAKELSIEDVSSLTGFARNTLNAIENGSNTDTTHLIEIAKAIGVHPMELFNVEIEIKSRYKLSPQRLARNLLTLRINKLGSETNFFDTPKFVSEVIQHLFEEFKIKADSIHTSVVLKRMVADGKLKFTKVGRQNQYGIKKK